MAPLPKRRHSTRRGGKRKAVIVLSFASGIKCPSCGKLKLSHRICKYCGSYKGQNIVIKKEKTKKKK